MNSSPFSFRVSHFKITDMALSGKIGTPENKYFEALNGILKRHNLAHTHTIHNDCISQPLGHIQEYVVCSNLIYATETKWARDSMNLEGVVPKSDLISMHIKYTRRDSARREGNTRTNRIVFSTTPRP
jgi:hypothetical protein